MNDILLWLWRKFTAYIEGALDPESAARAKAFEARVAIAEAAEKEALEAERESQIAYAESVARRAGWDTKIAASLKTEEESKQRLADSQARIKVINDEAVAAKKKLDDLVGADRVRVDL